MCQCLLTILHQCTEAVQCKHSLPVILTESKNFSLGFDSRQSRTGHPQSKILATPMRGTTAVTTSLCVSQRHRTTPLLTPSVHMIQDMVALSSSTVSVSLVRGSRYRLCQRLKVSVYACQPTVSRSFCLLSIDQGRLAHPACSMMNCRLCSSRSYCRVTLSS